MEVSRPLALVSERFRGRATVRVRCCGCSDVLSAGVLRNEDAWRSLQATELMDDIRRRWPAGMWTMRWDAENEFGHWDGLRLRKVKLGTKVTIPKAVEAAVKTED